MVDAWVPLVLITLCDSDYTSLLGVSLLMHGDLPAGAASPKHCRSPNVSLLYYEAPHQASLHVKWCVRVVTAPLEPAVFTQCCAFVDFSLM